MAIAVDNECSNGCYPLYEEVRSTWYVVRGMRIFFRFVYNVLRTTYSILFGDIDVNEQMSSGSCLCWWLRSHALPLRERFLCVYVYSDFFLRYLLLKKSCHCIHPENIRK